MSARPSVLVGVPTEAKAVVVRPSQSSQRQRPSEPWSPAAMTRLAGLTGAGLLTIGVSWFGASGTVGLSQQLLWTVLGILGTTFVAVSQGMFVLEALRVIKARRLGVMVNLQTLVGAGAADSASALAHAGAEVRIASEAMTHFHRPACLLTTGKDVTIHATGAEHVAAGRTACGVCAA